MDSEEKTYWEGKARWFDGRQALSRLVRVVIGPDGLRLLDGDLAGRYGSADLELLEDETEGYFRLRLKSHPDHVLAFHGHEPMEWMRALGLLRRPWLWGLPSGRKVALLLLILAALSGLFYFVGLDLAVDGVVGLLPRSTDRLLGEAAARTLASDTTAPGDSAAERALAKSRDLVRSLCTDAGDSIRILVVRDSSEKNAFAFPGGSIVIYTGMLRMLESQEEWLGLLAHEGAHVYLRHGMRGVVRGSLLAFGASVVFGDLSGMGTLLADNAGTLANLSYGRKQEAAADRFAIERLRANGYDATGLASLFHKLLDQKSLPGWAEFLSTHPSTESRIRALGGKKTGPGKVLLTAEEWAAMRNL
ncbi:MAG TPA: M48 family metallopeptidase [Fibrobacteria bacterium]|nr:M48 family metallopeptidase [Fibrobacteria bacterium]